jgi:cytoskeletal protein RodZ
MVKRRSLAANSVAASDEGGKVAMPLDTGAVTQQMLRSAGVGIDDAERNQGPGLAGALNIGAALRAERQRQGLSLQDVADATRVRRNYLESLEAMRLDELPSRPFTIGYVRAYAQVLNLDPEAAIARFKEDFPDKIEPLRPPVGVRKGKDGRLQLLAAGLVVVVAAIVAWNIARHAMLDDAPPPPSVPETPQLEAAASAKPTGVLSVSAAEPAPADSTLPKPYLPPGLRPSAPVSGAAAESSSAPAAPEAAAEPSAAPPPIFVPRASVYGASPGNAAVILQAKKSATLVMHNPDGSVFFARQLAAGEAYGAPIGRALSFDVSDPAAFNVYVGGQLHAPLPALKGPVASLTR